MSKFTLEIELKDDKLCLNCPCLEGYKCAVTRTILSVINSNEYFIRPSNCPLKPIEPTQPEHKCETCKWDRSTKIGCWDCIIGTKDYWEQKETE